MTDIKALHYGVGWSRRILAPLVLVLFLGPVVSAQALVAPDSGRTNTVDGLRIQLLHARRPAQVISQGVLVKLDAGKRWLATQWRFTDVSRHQVTIHPPVADAGKYVDRARYLGGVAPAYTLGPGQQSVIDWYFEIPVKATGVWIRYDAAARSVLWYHVKM